MRVTLFLAGVLVMNPGVADDKKDGKKPDPNFPETVSWRHLVKNPNEKFFLKEADVSARFVEVKGRQVWRVKSATIPYGNPIAGSEIVSTDKGGNRTTWVVKKIQAGEGVHVCDCEKQERPAKKP